MTSKDLKHRVAIILSQAARNPIFYRDKQSAMSPLDVISRSPLEIMIESVRKAELEVLHSRQARDILIVDLDETELDNEQLLLLRTLYAQLPSRLKKAFVPVLF